jgi:hypothetical protein
MDQEVQVESSYECGNEIRGSENAGKRSSGCTTGGPSSSVQFYIVS